MPVPYTFGSATSSIPLSQLDSNFATAITIGNTAVQLGNTVTTLNNMTLANVTISSGTVTITNVAVTTANVSGTANISTLVVVGNETVGGNTTITGNITAANANVTTNLVLSGGTANGVAYLNSNKVLTTGSALVFDGSNLGLGVTPSAWLTSYSNKAMQIGPVGVVYGNTVSAGNQQMAVANNLYLDSSANTRYITSDYASRYIQYAGQHRWDICASGTAGGLASLTPAMTLDASGNLSVGTTTASTAGANYQAVTVNGSSGSNLALNGGGTGIGLIYAAAGNSNLYVTNQTASGNLIFGAGSGNERARIDSSGNFMVGVTSTGARIAAKNTGYTSTTRTSGEIFVGASNGSGADCTLHFTDSVAYNYYFGGYNGTAYVTTNNSGGVKLSSGATSWAADSDERLKNIKEPITNAVENLCSLRTVYGNYKTDEENVSRLFLIAQDVQKVYPETVDIGQDEEQTLSFRAVDLIPVLVAAIKEQQAIIQSLTARITALEGA